MLSSWFFRVFRLVITSAICSSPIYFAYLVSIPDKAILFLSFIAFIIVTGIDTYYFSFDFWNKKNYYSGVLFPFVIYAGMGVATCLVFPPAVFNRIFLPLRFAGSFGMSTMGSIGIVSIAVLAIVTALRFFGARAGRLFFEEIQSQAVEMEEFAAKLEESMRDDNIKA